ncbi:hypothetical protein THRCLA_06335 [Thraustotheca clavata]|uniref:Secreted protein n=1 Tax=Thraustotheca clavata TaxID=74557 RepID=A0A0A7CLG2_9STRA|nr:secreted protein [Thraustotheca clavata]OQR99921.1 hypothetical protein THRCLA_06335 [Thraustotheca clavata]
MKTSLTALVVFATASTTQGWWDTGHMTTAEIASQLMKPDDVKTINTILSRWDGQFPNTGEITTAAIWPDLIKCSSKSAICPSPAVPSLAMGDNWHFVNLPLYTNGSDWHGLTSKDGAKLIQASFGGFGLNTLNNALSTVQKSGSNWSVNYLVRYLLHVFGDMHQPLHAVTGISSDFPNGDLGGNSYALRQPCVATNLHAYWDGVGNLYPGNWSPTMSGNDPARVELTKNATALIQKFQGQADPLNFQQYSSLSWKDFVSAMSKVGYLSLVLESYDLARNVVYKDIDLTVDGSKKIACPSSDYQKKVLDTVQLRFYLGGSRLAVILTQVAAQLRQSTLVTNVHTMMIRGGKPLVPPIAIEPPAQVEEGSQLAEATPQIDLPQRMDAPIMMNTPERVPSMTRDARVRQLIFSARAIGQRKYKEIHTYDVPPNKVDLDHPLETAHEAKLLKDYTMLAASSKRAGKSEAEATAYFAMGIIFDNLDEFERAIEVYKKALVLLKDSEKVAFRGLVHSCIGVDYQLLSSGNVAYSGRFVAASSTELEHALTYHKNHLDLNTDDAGTFVAHTNIGLTLGSLARFTEAAKHHQEALRLAIRLNSAYGQSIAVGNLGLLASRQGDLATARACMDQHLQLIQTVQDRSAEVNAWMQLGFLSMREQEYEKASRYFEQAYELAKELNEIGVMKQASCYLGIARGCQRLPALFSCVNPKK